MSAFVYMLRCSDGSYYVGSTRKGLEGRGAEHNEGLYGGYTKARRPVELVFQQSFDRIEDAIAAKRQIKGWSRAKNEALVRGDWDRLRHLAASSFVEAAKSTSPEPRMRTTEKVSGEKA
ncbi:MAG: GIY-YIG nuclease family protein [Alphaproteobacteria bacterium]|nr:GIY-YIG nuclease family protein [Alphaproteobacteria bacterium]